ncbi:EAL domain-containing protein [Acetobacterium paludosum]|nr:EAL domain-containing protein [Acetobacterium paludosum]
MMILDTRIQIVTICFFIIVYSDHIRNKKLPLLSNYFFSMMLFFTAGNLFFDLVKVYTIIYMDVVSPLINRLCNQLFYATLIMIVAFLFWYVEILGHNQKRMEWKKLTFSLLLLLFPMYMIVFGELNYYIEDNHVYAYGSMTDAFSLTVLIYGIMIIIDTFLYKDTIGKDNRFAIRLGVMVLIGGVVVQFFNHGLLTLGVTITLMILFIYLSLENPKEYVDEDTGTFNKRAFHLMMEEKKEADRSLILVSVVVDDLNKIQTMVGHDRTNHVLKIIGDQMNEVFQLEEHFHGKMMKQVYEFSMQHKRKKIRNTFLSSAYHTRSNVMTFLVEQPLESIQDQLNQLSMFIKEPITCSQYTIAIKAHIDVILTDVYKEQSSCDEVYEMMNYMANHNEARSDTNVHFLDEEIISQKMRYTTIENILRDAIANQGFDMVYQPIYHSKTGDFLSAEALVRLTDTTTVGFVSPEEFIPIAEKKGMIMELGQIVFEKVCAFARKKCLQEIGIEYIEVNLSGIQCMHPDLPSQLQKIMQKYEITPGFINLEITETAFVESGEMLQVNMHELRDMGCSFSMDDFGTGYSNLSRMAEVTYDLVKLDKSLIWPCFSEESGKANAILESVIRLLHQLNVKIVAEGVETEEMAIYLNEHGVTCLQGYYYSKPIGEEAYYNFLLNDQRGRLSLT